MKATNIRIVGLDEEDEENLPERIINLVTKQMKIDNFTTNDIKAVSRMGVRRQAKTRDILLNIHSSEKRDMVYQKRKVLMSRDNPIYLNEDLTSIRSKLFFEARKFRKRGKLFGTWSQQGNIMIKLEDASPPQNVRNLMQLKLIIQQHSNWDSNNTEDDYNQDVD